MAGGIVKALFLDRDGVINEEINYLYRKEEFCFMDGIIDVMQHFQDRGYLLIVVTNQSGIGRGYYTEEDFHILNDWMLDQLACRGVNIAKVYYSPYHPEKGLGRYKLDTFCRKPNPGMIFQAQQDFGINLRESLLLGDKESDIEAGVRAGVGTTVLYCAQHDTNVTAGPTKADYVIQSLKDLIDIANDKKFIS